MENKSNLSNEEAELLLKDLLEEPDVREEIRLRFIGVAAKWAVDNDKAKEIADLVRQFKTIIGACLNAKVDTDVRAVIIALQVMVEDFAVAQVKGNASIVVRNVPDSGPSLGPSPVEGKEWKQ